MPDEMKKEPEKYHQCDVCQGEGKVPIGEHLVTRDMAIDAGDRSLEGSFHSYEYELCEQCHGGGIDETSPRPEWMLWAEQQIISLTTALEKAREAGMKRVLDELGSLPAIYFGEGSPSIALGNQMFLCAKLRKQFLKEDKQ